jgi:hypothetical protein
VVGMPLRISSAVVVVMVKSLVEGDQLEACGV